MMTDKRQIGRGQDTLLVDKWGWRREDNAYTAQENPNKMPAGGKQEEEGSRREEAMGR